MPIGTLRTLRVGLPAIAVVVGARGAAACSVCISATQETREAYYGTTLLLILLPLLLIGALLYWLRRAARAPEAESDPPGVAEGPRDRELPSEPLHRRVPPSPAMRARRLAHGFAGLSAATFCLIVLGALVRANGAGLACPDWPLCFGQLVPQLDAKVAFEWGHRLLAGSVALGLLGLTWAGRRRSELRNLLKPRLAIAWALLATQVVFGGLTVLLLLAPWTVSVHLLLGNAFCLTLLWIARDLYEIEGRAAPRARPSGAVSALTAITATCLILQLVLGGMVASRYAGLACVAFPTCDGQSLVPTLSGPMGLHVLHRLNGFALLISFALLAWTTRRSGRMGHLARTGLGLVILQIALGAADVLLRLPVEVTGLHTAAAAAIVLTTALLARELTRAPGEVWGTHAPSPRMAEA